MSKIQVSNPTGNGDGTPGKWIICTTPLSCGLRVLEGWSEGVGIPSNKDNFENRFYALLKLSSEYKPKYPNPKGVWNTFNLDGKSMAPIGVARYRQQYLE